MLSSFQYRLLQWRLWLIERLNGSEQPATLFWAGVVGLGGGLASVLFKIAMHAVQYALTGHHGSFVETSMALPKWQRFITPGIGGLIAGAIMHYGMRLTRSQKTSDYMEALVVGDGVIGLRTTSIKTISSLFIISSGGVVGREGCMVTLSAMLASIVGRGLRFSTARLKLIVSCGTAAGVAAAYNAPIAGALFVAEIILGTISMEIFGPLVVSSMVSTFTVHQIMGARPTYAIPPFHIVSNWEFPLYLLLGLLAGTSSPLFIGLIKNSESLFTRLHWPAYSRMMLGGLIVGMISTLCPQVWGNGYSVVNSILDTNWLWSELLLVFVCKLMSIGSTVGSGAVGGVFTPTLFVGAVLGCLYGKGVHFLFPHFYTISNGYALVGMGCFLAATTQAPLMAILMIFEMTLQYDIVLPLMLSCVTANYVSRGLGQHSIYAGHMKRKEDELPATARTNPTTVQDLMRVDPPCVSPATSFGKIALIFSTHRINYVYVVDEDKRFLGVVSLHEMKPYLNDPVMSSSVIAVDFMREDFPLLTPGQHLTEALGVFTRHEGERIPVVNGEHQLVGVISKTDLLLTLSGMIRS